MRILGGNATDGGGAGSATSGGGAVNATFSGELAAAPTGTRRAPLTREIALDVPAPVRPPKILVLEDEEPLRTLVSAMLKIRGFECDLTGTVREARSFMAKRAYDLVLADVHLPDGSGLSLAKESGGDPLLIVMTGSNDIQTAVQAIREGAIDFITKPFPVGQFLKRIDNALQEWRSRESLKGYARALETLVKMKGEELSRTSRQIDDVYDMTV